MAQTYTVKTLGPDGQWIEQVHTMSPEMEEIYASIKKFNDENPDFWCKCDEPVTGAITPRGHSVDVDCAKCGGCLQVG